MGASPRGSMAVFRMLGILLCFAGLHGVRVLRKMNNGFAEWPLSLRGIAGRVAE